MSDAHIGIPFTEKRKENISKSLKNKSKSFEHIQKIKLSKKGKENIQKRKKVIDIITNRVFESLKEASGFSGYNYNYLSDVLSGKLKNNTNLKYAN